MNFVIFLSLFFFAIVIDKFHIFYLHLKSNLCHFFYAFSIFQSPRAFIIHVYSLSVFLEHSYYCTTCHIHHMYMRMVSEQSVEEALRLNFIFLSCWICFCSWLSFLICFCSYFCSCLSWS